MHQEYAAPPKSVFPDVLGAAAIRIREPWKVRSGPAGEKARRLNPDHAPAEKSSDFPTNTVTAKAPPLNTRSSRLIL